MNMDTGMRRGVSIRASAYGLPRGRTLHSLVLDVLSALDSIEGDDDYSNIIRGLLINEFSVRLRSILGRGDYWVLKMLRAQSGQSFHSQTAYSRGQLKAWLGYFRLWEFISRSNDGCAAVTYRQFKAVRVKGLGLKEKACLVKEAIQNGLSLSCLRKKARAKVAGGNGMLDGTNPDRFTFPISRTTRSGKKCTAYVTITTKSSSDDIDPEGGTGAIPIPLPVGNEMDVVPVVWDQGELRMAA